MTLENRLGEVQQADASAYLDRLPSVDRTNVEQIVTITKELAERYEQESTTYKAIFGVYGIGGYVTKEGQRPDVDVLVVGNGHWRQRYSPLRTPEGQRSYHRKTGGDHILGSLADHFVNNGFDVEIPKELPDDYTYGTNPKTLMRLKPQEGNNASSIDIVYVKGNYSWPAIRTFEDFYRYDIAPEGQDLGRVALLETVFTQPTFEQHYGRPDLFRIF